MIITVKSDFPAHVQQIISEITETLNVSIPFQRCLVLIGIVFNNNPCIFYAILFSQGFDIRPPDVDIEGADIHVIIPLDIFSFTDWNGRGKIIQIECGGIDYRIDTDIGEQTVGSSVKTAVCLFKVVQVIYDHLSLTERILPDDRHLSFIRAHQVDNAVIIQGDRTGGSVRIGDLIILQPAAYHKV